MDPVLNKGSIKVSILVALKNCRALDFVFLP